MAKEIRRKSSIILLLGIIFFIGIMINNKAEANTDNDITSTFQDANLRNAIIEIIKQVEKDDKKNNILESDIDKITDKKLPSGKQINLAGKGISNLAGLEIFADKEIEWIYLDWNEISDISVLKNFETVTKISASGNRIKDISPIVNLSKLKNINFSNNSIVDISTIISLHQLEYLLIANNQITGIPSLRHLTKLKEINIAGNQISNIDNILEVQSIQTLEASKNKIISIEQASSNMNLKQLSIYENELISLEGIEKFPNLEILDASNNKIVSLLGIESLINLYNLNLNKNQIMNIKLLKDLKNLQYIYLDSNHIVELDAIENLENLKKITYYNQTYYLAAVEEYEAEELTITLSSMFKSFYDKNSKLYNANISYEMENNIEYKIAEDKSFIKIKTADLKKQDITFKMLDKENTYIYLIISWKVPEKQPEVENKEISEIYNFKDVYVYNVTENTNIAKFRSNLKVEAKITRAGQKLQEEDIIATGDSIEIQNKTYYIIIKGDTDKDGIINIKDIMKLTRAIIGNTKLENVQLLAADVNSDNYIDNRDLIQLQRTIIENSKKIGISTKEENQELYNISFQTNNSKIDISKQNKITLDVKLNNYIGDGILGYQAKLDYDKEIFKNYQINTVESWEVLEQDSQTGIFIASSKKATKGSIIAKITLEVKEGTMDQATKVELNDILLTNGDTSESSKLEKEIILTKTQESNNDITKKQETKYETQITTTTPTITLTQKENTATTTIPQTGISDNILIIIGTIILLGILGFIRYKTIELK